MDKRKRPISRHDLSARIDAGATPIIVDALLEGFAIAPNNIMGIGQTLLGDDSAPLVITSIKKDD